MENNSLSAKEQYDLRRQEKGGEQHQSVRRRSAKRWLKIIAVLLVLAVGIVVLGRYVKSLPVPDPLAICIEHQNLAMHIHPQLTISIKGQNQAIPANTGISPTCMRPIHTHDDTGTLHVEFPYKYEAKLGDFFKIWGKQFNSNCIFDNCNGPNGVLKMYVNGKENTEFENYIMKDLDKIEIIFSNLSELN